MPAGRARTCPDDDVGEAVAVARPCTELAKITGRGNDTAAEMEEPDAIDQHPRHEWLLTTGQPAGVGEAAPGRGQRWIVGANVRGNFGIWIFDFGLAFAICEYGQLARLDRLFWLVYVAAIEDECLRNLAGDFGEARNEVLGRAFCLQCLLALVKVLV